MEETHKEDYLANFKDLIRKLSYIVSFIFGFKLIIIGNIFKNLTYKYCDFIFKSPDNGGLNKLFISFIIYIIINSFIYVCTRKKNKKEDCFWIYNVLCLILGIIAFYCLGFVLFFRCDTGP